MKFKVGDRVKFLNESGGGIITKIVNSNLVHVSIEEGFDIPTLPSDLILVNKEVVPGRSFFNEDILQDEKEIEPKYTHEVSSEGNIATGRNSFLSYGKNAVQKGIYISFVPQDQKFLISGGIHVYILNHTDYDVRYNWIIRDGEYFVVKDSDLIKSDQKILIDTFERTELNDILEGFVQVMFQSNKMLEIPLPTSSHYKIQGSKFYQENSYKKEPLLNEIAITTTISEWSSVEKLNDKNISSFSKLGEKYQVKSEKKKILKPKELIEQHKISPLEAEVDLHISTLREDYQKMNSGEILNYQIDYFRSTLESALKNHYHKIIFIHGIGNGILKSKITKIIREEYPDLTIRNAQFLQYGNGAIEVNLQGYK